MKLRNLLKLLKQKRGALSLIEMPTAFIILVAGIITVAIGALILNNVMSLTPAGSVANTTVSNGLQALSTGSSLFPVLGIIVVASVIIGLVFMFRQ